MRDNSSKEFQQREETPLVVVHDPIKTAASNEESVVRKLESLSMITNPSDMFEFYGI